MKLYVCWTTAQIPRPGGHPCAHAYRAVTGAGHSPEVVKVRGRGVGPEALRWITDGRREVRELTGDDAVPVLVTDSAEVIAGSERIVAWAESNPAA